MNSDLTESVQSSIRPGEMVDTYYFGETNLEKQAYPAVVKLRRTEPTARKPRPATP